MAQRPTAEEVAALFERYQRTGRRRDRNALVEAHIGFAHHIARRYANRGVPDEDLRQLALLALVQAVDRFDPDVGAAFTSFAGRTIEGVIKRHFRDATWRVRVPRSTKNLHLQVRKANDELAAELGRSPTVREVARHLDVEVDSVVEALGAAAAFSPAPLEGGTGDEPGSADRSSRLASDDTALEATPERIHVERLLARLPERERTIVELRFYDELTQSQIAEQVGVSQMHVSRLLRRSLELLRRWADDPAADGTDPETGDAEPTGAD